MIYKIEGTKYSRDVGNMALLCSDLSVVRKYEATIQLKRENQRRDAEINSLKEDISEIKSMLQQILSRG
jgi:hypothetical protein